MLLFEREAVVEEPLVVLRGAAQQRLDGALGLGVGQVPAEQRPVVDQCADEVEQLVAVGVGPQVAAGDRPVEGAADRPAGRFDDGLEVARLQLGVWFAFEVEGIEDLGADRPVGGEEDVEALVEVAQGASGVGGDGTSRRVAIASSTSGARPGQRR
ncbi:hypothetical protein GCM10029992_57130 [Glycomyces albus]